MIDKKSHKYYNFTASGTIFLDLLSLPLLILANIPSFIG